MGRSLMARLLPLLLAGLLAGCATAPAGATPDLLTLYDELVEARQHGFSCYPAAYRGGPGDPRIEALGERLGQRQRRVRERLVARFGAARIDEIENAIVEQEHYIYYTRCDLDDTARARKRYGRLVRAMERQVGLGE
jgi:hypothetical protein